MTLDSYLVSKGITEPAFAAMVGLNQSTVNRLRKGSVPSSTKSNQGGGFSYGDDLNDEVPF